MTCRANTMSANKASYINGPLEKTSSTVEPAVVGVNAITLAKDQPLSMVRFLYVIPGDVDVDIYLNQKMVMSGVPYGSLSNYIRIHSGTYELYITAGDSNKVILSGKVTFDYRSKYTVLITGNEPALFLMEDQRICPMEGKALLRVMNTAAGSPNIDVYVNNRRVLENIPFCRVGEPNYLAVDAGAVDIGITIAGTSKVLLGPMPSLLQDKHVYTVYTSGIVGDRQYPYGAIVSDDAKNFCMYV